jgi:hypothetical protein
MKSDSPPAMISENAVPVDSECQSRIRVQHWQAGLHSLGPAERPRP